MKTKAIDAVERGNREWIEAAEPLARRYFVRLKRMYVKNSFAGRPWFDTDELWAATAKVGSPRERRAMGALMRRLQRDGVVKPLERWRPSTRKSCHQRPLRVWEVV